MTFWPLTNSDFPTDQTFHQFHDLYTELDFNRIMSGFHGAFATGVASQQGTLTLSDTWFRPPFWDLLLLQLLRPDSSNFPCLYSTFHLEYPLVLSRFCLFEIQPLTLKLLHLSTKLEIQRLIFQFPTLMFEIQRIIFQIINGRWQVETYLNKLKHSNFVLSYWNSKMKFEI